MSTRIASLVVSVLLLGLAAPARGDAPAYATDTVEQAAGAGEPSVAIDPSDPARIYIAAPESRTQLWRSDDGGVSFRKVHATLGNSGDSDVAVDADGVVYASDLSGGIPVSVSFDHADTFAYKTTPTTLAGLDRQWLAAEGHGHVVETVHAGSNMLAWVSRDQARTFSGPFVVAPNISFPGPIAFSKDGRTLWASYDVSGIVSWARSDDGGTTWVRGRAAHSPGNKSGVLFSVIDSDDDGNVYIAWAAGDTQSAGVFPGASVYVTSSTDRGAHWSDPVEVSDPNREAVQPWLAAGAGGKVDVGFYAATQFAGLPNLGADLGGPQTTWDVDVAQSLDATAASPTWTRTVAAANVHTGSVCTFGIACAGQFTFVNVPKPFDRRMLDFFEIAVDPSGHVVFPHPQDRPLTTPEVTDTTDLEFVRQTAGPTVR